jgi:hypothetical protein
MDCELSSYIDNLANGLGLDSSAVVLIQCGLSTVNKGTAPEVRRSALCRPPPDPGKPEPDYFDRDLGHGAFAILADVRPAFHDHHGLAEVAVLLAVAYCEGARPKGLGRKLIADASARITPVAVPANIFARISLVSASASVLHLEGEIKGRRK